MNTLNLLYYDFDIKSDRLLKMRMDSYCYDVQLIYIPFLEVTDYFIEIENLDLTIQFLVLSNPHFDGTLSILSNIVKLNNEGMYQTQTMMISITKVTPENRNSYTDILPQRLDEKKYLKNINRFSYPIKPFDEMFPQK